MTGQSAGFGGGGRGRPHRFRQAGQVPGLGQHGGHLLLISQEVLIEGGEQGGQTLVDGGDPRLGSGIQPGAGPDELGVMMPDQPLFLRGQPALFGRFVDGGDAGKKLRVLHDLIAERRQPRFHFPFHRLELRIAQGRAPDPVDRPGPGIDAPGLFHRRDGVSEGRRCRILGDGLDFFAVGRHRCLKCRRKIRHAHPVERRHSTLRPGPRRQERVIGPRCPGDGGTRQCQGGAGGEHFTHTLSFPFHGSILMAGRLPRPAGVGAEVL